MSTIVAMVGRAEVTAEHPFAVIVGEPNDFDGATFGILSIESHEPAARVSIEPSAWVVTVHEPGPARIAVRLANGRTHTLTLIAFEPETLARIPDRARDGSRTHDRAKKLAILRDVAAAGPARTRSGLSRDLHGFDFAEFGG